MENPTIEVWYSRMAEVTKAINENRALPYTYMGYKEFCKAWNNNIIK
jgi:hypothetical protein